MQFVWVLTVRTSGSGGIIWALGAHYLGSGGISFGFWGRIIQVLVAHHLGSGGASFGSGGISLGFWGIRQRNSTPLRFVHHDSDAHCLGSGAYTSALTSDVISRVLGASMFGTGNAAIIVIGLSESSPSLTIRVLGVSMDFSGSRGMSFEFELKAMHLGSRLFGF